MRPRCPAGFQKIFTQLVYNVVQTWYRIYIDADEATATKGLPMTTPTTSDLDLEISKLRVALQEAANERAQARNEAYQTRCAKQALEEAVRDAIKERVDNDDIDRDIANSLLEELGLKTLNRRFNVVVTVLVEVEGLEAEDEDEAERDARNAVENALGLYNLEGEYEDVSDNIESIEVTEE